MEDTAGRQLGLCVVWSKSPCLACPSGPKHQGKEHHKDIAEGSTSNVAVRDSDLETSETEDDSVHDKDDGLREGVGDPIHDTVEKGFPGECEREGGGNKLSVEHDGVQSCMHIQCAKLLADFGQFPFILLQHLVGCLLESL